MRERFLWRRDMYPYVAVSAGNYAAWIYLPGTALSLSINLGYWDYAARCSVRMAADSMRDTRLWLIRMATPVSA